MKFLTLKNTGLNPVETTESLKQHANSRSNAQTFYKENKRR